MKSRTKNTGSLRSGILGGLGWVGGSMFKPADPNVPSKKFEAYGLLTGLSVGTVIGILTLIFGVSALSVPLGGLPLAALIPIWIAYVALSAGLYAGALKYLGRVMDAFADMYAGRKVTNQQIGTIIGSFIGLFLSLSMLFFPFLPIPLPTVALLLIEQAPMIWWQVQALTILLVTCAFGSLGDKFGQITGFFITEATLLDAAEACWRKVGNWWQGRTHENIPNNSHQHIRATLRPSQESSADAKHQQTVQPKNASQIRVEVARLVDTGILDEEEGKIIFQKRLKEFRGTRPRPSSCGFYHSPVQQQSVLQSVASRRLSVSKIGGAY